jgi:catechol 2,3-dioxygenase-like lactoylglutathione lyase family enzyme
MSVTFRYTIVYVPDVPGALAFYERAFGLPVRFRDPEGQYGELDTGSTVLAFASTDLGRSNLPGGFVPHDPAGPPLGTELAFAGDDVAAMFAAALEAGATAVAEPKEKPWGQTIGYVRDPHGVLLELCTPLD